MFVHGTEVRGVKVDAETRCSHYDTERDVIAIRFPCCNEYYPCFRCHDEVAGHSRETWPENRRDAEAVLCGACGSELTIAEYLGCESQCPDCGTAFNPGCANHYHLYFEG
ncbi:CHY zinc finger protein [Haladaptatus pallidirubidus]|uniref:CHY zinc finger protein n=1 Tax=Haladaptatus pallidirubidus TaxID=1008152 RepID=A0AAV3UM01_9EURY|nr:CHY zinc finger protein [Haladaptatus pallidirubidus]